MSASEAPETADHVEVEWQFDALDVRPVARWLEGFSSNSAKVSPSGEKEMSDVYLDTDDWRMFRAGYALRIREKGGEIEATMKLVASSFDDDGGVKKRREISESLSSNDPFELPKSGGPVGERVHALVGQKSIRTLFEVRTKRKTYEAAFDVDGAGGDGVDGEAASLAESVAATVAEVALDETEIPVGDGAPAVLRRVEVEVESGTTDLVSPFVEELRRGCRLTPSTTSKFEAGLLASELSPPVEPDFGPTEVSSSMPVGEVAYAVMRGQFGKFLAHEPGTRIGEDSEELHDMRVTGRRLRAAMQIFKDALPVRSKKLRDELKWISGVLGEVRDLDVQLEQLEEWISDAAPDDREPLGELRDVLEERRTKERRAMLRALDSRRYAKFVETYSAFLVRGPARRSEYARRTVREVGPELITKRYRKFRKAGDVVEKGSPAEDYHELRKRGKRLRYALEFFSKIYGKPATDLTKSLKSLQDVLGDHQDAEVAMSQLRELALPAKERRGGAVSPRTVFVMGGISHRYETLVGELREEFPPAYSEVKGKRWKRLKNKMDKDRPGAE
ncbi:MAG: CHAD domain-containing protein [Rubrobacter sp.]|nr:CHAD domain-containing protein [Rubrobacter sp.]